MRGAFRAVCLCIATGVLAGGAGAGDPGDSGGAAAAGEISAARDRFDRASALTLAGDHRGALAEYEAFLKTDPRGEMAPVAAIAIANLHRQALDDPAAAAEAYARVTADYRESPWAGEAARRRGECLQSLEQWQGAGEAYRQALELSGGAASEVTSQWVNEVSLAAADCFYQLGDRSQVIATYERALAAELPPQSAAAVLYRLGDCYEAGHEPAKAAGCYARVITEFPFAPAFDQAMERDSVIAAHVEIPWEPYRHFQQAGTLLRARDYAAALEHSEQAIATTQSAALRDCARYRRIMASTLLAGDFTKGAEDLDALLSGLPDRRAMPNAQQQLDQYRRVAGLEAQARAAPQDAAAQRALGGTYLQSGLIPQAVTVLERARDLDPADSGTQRLLGFAYANAGRSADAQAALDVYLRENPDDGTTLNAIGYACLQSGDAEAAVGYFRRYVAAAPDDPNAHDSLGEGLLGAGKLEEAVREYERAVEIDPGFFNSHYMLGDLYGRLGRMEDAAAAYRRALSLAPDDARGEAARAAIEAKSQG